jgi:hypothetical protein
MASTYPQTSWGCARVDLQEVNDRGIILSVEHHVRHPAQILFYPWNAVIQLSKEQNT